MMGRVYVWRPDPQRLVGGRVELSIVPLPRLDAPVDGRMRLSGQYVEVRNAGEIHIPGTGAGSLQMMKLGDAEPDEGGDFIFAPGRGGGRMDKVPLAKPARRARYLQAARFGEVNTYFHVDRIAEYVDELLQKLGERSLPRVLAFVNAHHGATEHEGVRDGVRGDVSGKCMPFQGGHYRLPTVRPFRIAGCKPVSSAGEIHFGPGRRLARHGALAEHAGRPYRRNASHNAGIVYHEYGHHVTRHTADFRANHLRAPHRQINKKTALDEGSCDYWTAAMLDSPHIWAWHCRHDRMHIHPRSLVSEVTMADFDERPNADAHENGTIWAVCLWDVRCALGAMESGGARRADLLVLETLLLLGRLQDHRYAPTVSGTRRLREGFDTALRVLLEADARLFRSAHQEVILAAFERRGIRPPDGDGFQVRGWREEQPPATAPVRFDKRVAQAIRRIHSRDADAIIPRTDELLSAAGLERRLANAAPLSLVAVGDVMLGERGTRCIDHHGLDYPFNAVVPLFRRASIVLANQEGPFAETAAKQTRNFTYKVNPKHAKILRRAAINIVTLANNHLLDCGRRGVLETFKVLKRQGIAYIGAGVDREAAHGPAIMRAGRFTVGLLGYYWNRRTAATRSLPGSAMDLPQRVATDIKRLRPLVDWVVVTVHWGVPYERIPTQEDRAKARFAIDCGADIVIGHHPHIVQPFEVYRGRPIFYSVGNFAFGSGNCRSESLALGVRFADELIDVTVYPAYVKNRDPRIDYQTKIMAGEAARRSLCRLKRISGSDGEALDIENDWGRLRARVSDRVILRSGRGLVLPTASVRAV